MIHSEIFSIGDEILIGQIIDTNSSYISNSLTTIGIHVNKTTSIPDKKEDIESILKNTENTDVIITTGGLGPTKDDITKKTIADFFKKDLIFNEQAYKNIERIFEKLKVPINSYNKEQAKIPDGTKTIINTQGTAPAMWTEYKNIKGKDTILINLPGVPFEMKHLMQTEIIPRLKKRFKTPFFIHKTILSVGIPESKLAEMLDDFEENLPKNISLAYLPNNSKVRLRLSGQSENKEQLERTIDLLIEKLKELLGDAFQPKEKAPIAEILGKILTDKKLTISSVESCTAGKISSLLTSVTGSSEYYKGSFVTYSKEMKSQLLDIPSALIKQKGIVSREMAEKMAIKGKQKLGTDICISTTGVAGPNSDEQGNKVGEIFIGLCIHDKIEVLNYHFEGLSREEFIHKVSERALIQVYKILQNYATDTH